jgi:hypothetical protein
MKWGSPLEWSVTIKRHKILYDMTIDFQTLHNLHQPSFVLWRAWRYEQVNQNPYIEEEQTTQWPNEKVQKDKQRSTKHTHIKLKNEWHEPH